MPNRNLSCSDQHIVSSSLKTSFKRIPKIIGTTGVFSLIRVYCIIIDGEDFVNSPRPGDGWQAALPPGRRLDTPCGRKGAWRSIPRYGGWVRDHWGDSSEYPGK